MYVVFKLLNISYKCFYMNENLEEKVEEMDLEEIKKQFEELEKLLTPENIASLSDEEITNLRQMYEALKFLINEENGIIDIDEEFNKEQ